MSSIEEYVTKYHTRFSTEVFLRKPTFFVSNDDLLSKMNPRDDWVLIGEGSSGEVYRAEWLGTEVAVKTSHDLTDETTIIEEFVLNSNIRHPNIVNFFVASPDFIVMELMENNTLDDLLLKQRSRKPEGDMRKRWCSHISMAVRYLHESGIVHSDIKPENIMLDSSWKAKLCDVGGGYFVNDEVLDKIYTEMYLPLTIHLESDKDTLGKKTDMYSLSVVIMCILSWEPDIYTLLGIPTFERMVSEQKSTRESIIDECLETSLPNAYNLIQGYDVSDDVKSFLFKMFSDPCREHIKNEEISGIIRENNERCRSLDFSCLKDI